MDVPGSAAGRRPQPDRAIAVRLMHLPLLLLTVLCSVWMLHAEGSTPS